MATHKTPQTLQNFVINKVPNSQTFENMITNNQVNANELYLIVDPDTPPVLGHTLTIGSYSFNGSQDVTIPIYDGYYTWS